jgi:hypothetical protein
MAKINEKSERYQNALRSLREHCPPGSDVYVTVTHVSRSGMSRNIKAFSCGINSDGKPEMQWLGGWISTVLGMPLTKDDGVKIGGCGMDLGFALVNSLSYAIHGRGNACPACTGHGVHPTERHPCHGRKHAAERVAALDGETFDASEWGRCCYCDDVGTIPDRCQACDGHGKVDEQGKAMHPGYTIKHRWL